MIQEFVSEMKKQMKKVTEGMHTALPAVINSFDPGSCTASVTPRAQFKKPNGEKMDFPAVSGVPVVFPQGMGQDATIAFPVKSGDECMVIFAEQSLDYAMYGKETDTDLKFDLSNAMCIPGLFMSGNSAVEEACSENAVVIDVSGTKLKVKDGEISMEAAEVKIKGNVTVEGNTTVSGTAKAAAHI